LKPTRPRGSGSFSETDNPWDQIRPAVEHVYDKLDKYFPGCDLDRPLIDSLSAPSPTMAEPPPIPMEEAERVQVRRNKKKSIRILARDRQDFIKRQSMMESPSAAKMRRRSTKLWDSRLQEVFAGDGPLESPGPASSPTRKYHFWNSKVLF